MMADEPRLDWTWEQVETAQTAWDAVHSEQEFGFSPLAKWAGLRRVDECHTRFEMGDQYALMTALRICACHTLAWPEWVAEAYIRGYDTVNNRRAKSWDEVFGSPLPKGAQLAAQRKKRKLMFAVHNAVTAEMARHPNRPIDEALFTEIGLPFNIGKTLTSEYYYDACGPCD